jgi:hypothetical protein
MKIIGIGGRARAGKDTAAKTLVQNGYVRIALADALKEFVSQSLEIPIEYFQRDDLKDKPFYTSIQLYVNEIILLLEDFCRLTGKDANTINWATIPQTANFKNPREALQFIGTELGRNIIDKDIWLKEFQKRAAKEEFVVVTDMRFQNEREFIKDLGGTLVKVNRKAVEESGDTHSSENNLGTDSEYDVVMDNDGTLEELEQKVVQTLISIKEE